MVVAQEIQISKRQMRHLVHNPSKSAEAVNLNYVHDNQAGIMRVKKGKGFSYYLNGKIITDKKNLERIKKLVLPPAWEKVWICTDPNGHLQATGLDSKNRKQYKYHALWNTLRNQTKFFNLIDFGYALPDIRRQLEIDLALPGLPHEKVLATVVSLMERTNIRIGNHVYEKFYGSHGLTTLKDKHVKISRDMMQFAFKGKKGISHSISVRSKRLATIVKKCRDIPGEDLFQYVDESGHYKCVDSGMVNHYIKDITGKEFSAKDFRTWAGSVQALLAFKEIGCCETITETKKNVVAALDIVSKHLGNTKSVCKKYYVHPVIISLYENKTLNKYIHAIESIEEAGDEKLAPEETILLNILKKEA